MSIDAKRSFLTLLEQKTSGFLTVADMTRLLRETAEVLDGFDIRELECVDEQADDLLRCYLDALAVEGRSEKTIARYDYVIRKMLSDVRTPIRRVSVYHLRSWLSSLKEHGMMDTSMEGNRQVICAFFHWLKKESLIENDPTMNLGKIKCAKRQKQTYSDADIERLVRACKRSRDKALIRFMASTGCRIGEVTELNRNQVDLDRCECVVHGKGNKERVVYLDDVTVMMIREYLNGRKDEDDALFYGQRGRLTPGGVRAMLKKVSGKAMVEHVHPHKFRRTLATNMNRRGMQIQLIANILGHDRLDTTMKYVNISHDDTRDAYRRYA